MNEQFQNSRINTGDWVGSAWDASPHWTPYGQAIADHYPIQVPWYWSTRVTLSAATSPVIQLMRPYLYDVLIFGAHAVTPSIGEGNTISGEFIYLNITHKQTGVPWATPNKIGSFPVFAIAGGAIGGPGSGTNVLYPMPVMKLPEAFFLPRNTQLRFDWSILSQTNLGTVTVQFTLLGVQLMNHRSGFQTPRQVTLPNGDVVEVGSRLPWFSTVPIGEYQSRSLNDFELNPGVQVCQFFPPQDCGVEIHDAYSNFVGQTNTAAQQVSVKFTDMGEQKSWTPDPAPMTAMFSAERQVNPAMPFTKPYFLKRGHRIQLLMQNNQAATVVLSGTTTLRGVRICQY